MSNDQQKIEAYNKFKSGNVTKADLAREYDVSPRSMGRWIEQGEKLAAAVPAVVNAVAPPRFPVTPVAPVVADVEETEEDVTISVLASRKSISLTKLVGDVIAGSVVISKDAANFDQIFKMIAESGLDQAVLLRAYQLSQPATMVEEMTEGRLTVNAKTGNVIYTPEIGQPFPVSGKLSKRIIETLRNQEIDGAKTLINFLNRLMANPSNRAVNELYGFLTHNDIALTEDGHFYAWKVVRSDYMDKHSNTMLNAVGTEVRVNRNQVDENSQVTCSYGLHVCAKQYIKSFYSSSDRVVKVKVDPADVVAIPKDYNDSKMRCCGYFVEEDVTDTFYNK